MHGLSFAIGVALAAAGPSPSGSGFELRYVDLQRIVDQLPAADAARRRLVAARQEAQGRADRKRQSLLARRSRMSVASFEQAAARLAKDIQAEEDALEAMQDRLLAPLLARLERARAGAETAERRVVRLDEAPLVGWPAKCDLTTWLRAAFDDASTELPSSPPDCRARRFRVVNVEALAVVSPRAKAAQQRVEAFRLRQQAVIDTRRKEVERLEGLAAEDPAQSARAARQRAALDALVIDVQDALSARKRAAEEEVYEALVQDLAGAARTLDDTAVVEATAHKPPQPSENGQAWARRALGLPPGPASKAVRAGAEQPPEPSRGLRPLRRR